MVECNDQFERLDGEMIAQPGSINRQYTQPVIELQDLSNILFDRYVILCLKFQFKTGGNKKYFFQNKTCFFFLSDHF